MISTDSNNTHMVFARTENIGNKKVHVVDQQASVLQVAREIATAKKLKENDDAFMMFNLDALYDRFELWKRELPEIELFYAMKCNSDELILRSLAALGVGFDCASKEEIEMVTRMGVSPDRIIYANPCKARSFIEHADGKGVQMMTFDCIEELEKIARHHKSPKLLLRFNVADPTSIHPPSGKFGADPENVAPHLLKHAAEMGIDIVGVSFHVGSGCNDPSVYRVALQHARNLFDIGLKLGHKMEIVDIGGGFPGAKHRDGLFEQMASVIRSAIDEFFPNSGVRFIAEPGRFFARSLCTLVANVISRKAVATTNDDDKSVRMHYTINDGMYGSFNCMKFDHARPVGRPLFDSDREQFLSTIWGQTCDSADRIEDNKMMRLLNVGDWLIYEEMGAYTTSASFTFNGFPSPATFHVVSENVWNNLGLSDNNNRDN